jgi:fluoride exporter
MFAGPTQNRRLIFNRQHMNMTSLLMVGAGGFLGSVTRYVTVYFVDRKMNALFPYGTLTVNILGSFILGLVLGITYKTPSPGNSNWKLFLTTGFCGGFTTFSTFALDNINLLEQKVAGVSALYIIASLAATLLAVFTGLLIGRWANS